MTSQFYFEPKFCDEIYVSTEPYNKYRESPYTINNDGVIHEDITAIEGLLLNPSKVGNNLESIVKIGIQSA